MTKLFIMVSVVNNQHCALDFAIRMAIRVSVEFSCVASALHTISYLISLSDSLISHLSILFR